MQNEGLAQGFGWSVLGMLALLFVAIPGALAFALVRHAGQAGDGVDGSSIGDVEH